MYYYLLLLLLCIVGGWCISDAIKEYKRKAYFLCGLDIMFSIITVLYSIAVIVVQFIDGVASQLV